MVKLSTSPCSTTTASALYLWLTVADWFSSLRTTTTATLVPFGATSPAFTGSTPAPTPSLLTKSLPVPLLPPSLCFALCLVPSDCLSYRPSCCCRRPDLSCFLFLTTEPVPCCGFRTIHH